ncbi:glycosyltransferase family 4 protein [Candidatus Sumerlaeota bacterium]|nr:glycosyltransferase family 4 protein [Candidatus Sumerlaeota bacterium]
MTSSAKILILTTEPLPLPGMAATGAGLRAWGLAFGLRSAGFGNVTIAFAADAMRGKALEQQIGWVKVFERSRIDEFIERENPDAVVFQHWGVFRELKRALPCPVAMDLAGPHLLERQLWGSSDPQADLREKLNALAQVDFVVCSGQFQRHYFLPFLIQAGHDPKSNLCPVIPFSLSPELPEPSRERDHAAFFYGGMFLPWQDPEGALRSTVKVLEERGRGKLVFVGGPHPSGDVSGGRFAALEEMLQRSSVVERSPVMPFDAMIARMRHCGVAIDLMPRNVERELAFPTRTIVYMWAGLPVIHNNYDELADPIAEAKAGWTFDPAHLDSVEKLVARLVGHREDVERRSENAQKLVRDRYTWDKTIEPLATWCTDPKRRTEKRAFSIQASLQGSAGNTGNDETPRRKPLGKIEYSPTRNMTDTSTGPWYLSPVIFLLALPVSLFLALFFLVVELARLLFRGNEKA